ncbi:MAG: sulfatase-like hydrolase/transferase [Proteobacteria bacterium]|nr:sulfatase-like hydrolase/transferase [Pseudomonadota bacterium]
MHYFTGKNRLKQVFLAYLANTIISMIIMLPLLLKAVNDAELPFINSFIMFFSNALWLNLIAILIPLLLCLKLFPERIFKLFTILSFSLLQAFLIADVKVFSYFKFHINAIVINFLTTEGAEDSLKLGTSTIILYLTIITLIILTQTFIIKNKLINSIRIPKKFILILISVIFLDKLLYAYADLKNRTDILSSARFFPFYQKFTAERFLTKLGVKPVKKDNISLNLKGKILNYPRSEIKCENLKKYNILFIVADGFRFDMLNPEVTPNLYNFGKENIILENHFSGGNGTRFGIFTLLYGLYGNLWHAFLDSRQSPVFLDILQKYGYDFSILSSTRLSYPEFRSTAFIKLQDYIFDTHTEPFSFKRDRIITDKLIDFLKKTEKPFFSFIFYNSSHQFYQYPLEYEKFKPVLTGDLNYMKNMTPETIEKLKNRYKNSLYYIDSLIKEILDFLKNKGKLEDTIILITGDHGEEFNENGFFSHTSAFNDYQIRTATVMHTPGLGRKRLTNITSHIDLVPTILSYMGCKTPISEYSHGKNIFSENSKDYTFSFNWYDGSIVTKDYRIVIPLTTEKTRLIEIYKSDDYKKIEDKEIIKRYNNAMSELTEGLGRFLK